MSAVAELFAGINSATRDALDRAVTTRTFQAREDLLRAGDHPSGVLLIRSGRVKVWFPTAAGNAVTLYHLHAGDPVGLIAVCRRMQMPASITAVTHVEAHRWPTATIYSLMETDAKLARNGLAILADAMNKLAGRMERVTGSASQRIARALLYLAGEQTMWTGGHEIKIDVTRQEIAELTGTSLFTASRTISGWAQEGLIDSGRGKVTIVNCAALAEIGNDPDILLK